MSVDWPIVRLGDYCSKIGSGATPRGGASVYLKEGEICLIRSQNVYNDGFKPDGLVYITGESAGKLKNVIIEKNDVLLNITGDSVARVCLAKEVYLPARVNQHVAIIRPVPEEFDPRYIRYLLASPSMQNLLVTIASVGATRNALTKNMIETLEVSKPPLDIQISIADNLESLDDKIELNRQTNQTLEHIAQAIFKSWFVDFEPVKAKIAAKHEWTRKNPTAEDGGSDDSFDNKAEALFIERAAMCAISGKSEEQLEQLSAETQQQLKTTAALFPDALVESELGEIPEGWEFKAFSEFANNVRVSIRPDKMKSDEVYVGLEHIDKISLSLTRWGMGSDVDSNKSGFLKGDILFGKLRPYFHKVCFAPSSGICSTDILVIRPKKETYSSLVAMQSFEPRFVEYANIRSTGTRMPRASWKDISEFCIASSSDELIGRFDIIVKPILDSLSFRVNESHYLSGLRDALLPKLLSGELSAEVRPMKAIA